MVDVLFVFCPSQRVDGISLEEKEKDNFRDSFVAGVAASVNIKPEDVILNYVKTPDILNDDGTGIDVIYTVIASDYSVNDLVETIESRQTTDDEVTYLKSAGYPYASCSAEVMTTVLVPITATPTKTPTGKPSEEPTARPTPLPTEEPTEGPTAKPSPRPTPLPTEEPSEGPTVKPTPRPTTLPTEEPSEGPTHKPSEGPTAEPTHAPYTVKPTPRPTQATPTVQPTVQPTMPRRTRSPTKMPVTPTPTVRPSFQPSEQPTRLVRTRKPTDVPTSVEPTEQPTRLVRTRKPTDYLEPTEQPTRMVRTRMPTDAAEPTEQPTRMIRTKMPTDMPVSAEPTMEPTTAEPTEQPTRMIRTRMPTEVPSVQPTEMRKTRIPTYQPTSATSEGCEDPGVVYVVGLQRIDNVNMEDAADPKFSAAIIKAVSESLGVPESQCEIQSIAAAKYTNYRGDAVDVIFSIYTAYGCPYDVDAIVRGKVTTDNVVAELNAAGFDAEASSEAILIDYSPTHTPTEMPTQGLVKVIVTQIVTGETCESIAKEGEFYKAFDEGIADGLQEPTCSVGIDHIEVGKGNHGCDVTYTITCVAGTNAAVIEAEALQQSTADACTASIQAKGYPTGVCGEVMIFEDTSPTPSPSEGYQIVFEAAQALEGVCVTEETLGSAEFVKAFESAIGECLKVDSTDVSIQDVKMNESDPPAVIVDYVVVVPDSSEGSTEMIHRLNDECIPQGVITELLYKGGYPECYARKEAEVIDRTPSQTPTSAPSFKIYELEAYHQIYGLDLENATTPEFESYFIDYVTEVAQSDVELIKIYDPRYTAVANRPGVAKSNDSNIVVEYRATSTRINDTTIEKNIDTAIYNGDFTKSLQEHGYDTATSTTPVYIIVLNPTLYPTGAPTVSPTPIEERFTDAEWAGIAVGVVFGAAALTMYSYYLYVHQCLRTPITGA